ncbi:MAG: hypothetical protein ACPG4T_00185 [Nannocystaceae bacterium]
MQRSHLTVPFLLAIGLAVGCGGGGERKSIADQIGPASKMRTDVTPKSTKTPEELAEARKKAGFKDQDDLAAENAKMFEKSAREYVKTRMKEYREFTKTFRESLDEIEKKATSFTSAKDPQKAFDKWRPEFGKKAKKHMKTYDALTGNGVEGGNTQASLSKAFRGWENLKNDLSPDVAKNERFAAVLKEIRDNLDEVDKALDDIDKDESLTVNKFYKPKKIKDDD